MDKVSRRAVVGGLAAAATCPAQLLAAQSVAEFYRGKTIRLLIGAAAGGGYDIAGRTIAPFLGAHIPGQPTVSVENMPGATSLIMTNYLYNSAPQDGTVIGIPNNNILLEPRLRLLSRDGGNVKFDVSKLHWIGTPVQDPFVLWVWSDAANSVADLRTKKVLVGSTGPGADNYSMPALVNRILGARMSIVSGYMGQSEIFIAVERHEIQGNSSGYSDLVTQRPEWLRDNKIRLLIQFGMERAAALPEVPTAAELTSTAEDRAMFLFEATKYSAARPIAAPPNAPAERVRALQQAFVATMQDANYQKEALKVGLTLTSLDGQKLSAIIGRINSTPQNVIDSLRSVLVAKSQ
jgi:tripartite-type tricarboxylate transporter receptor subunit TctC